LTPQEKLPSKPHDRSQLTTAP